MSSGVISGSYRLHSLSPVVVPCGDANLDDLQRHAPYEQARPQAKFTHNDVCNGRKLAQAVLGAMSSPTLSFETFSC